MAHRCGGVADGSDPRSIAAQVNTGDNGESIYVGAPVIAEDGAAVIARPDVRIALEGVGTDIEGQQVARLLMSKMLRDAATEQIGWSAPPAQFEVKGRRHP